MKDAGLDPDNDPKAYEKYFGKGHIMANQPKLKPGQKWASELKAAGREFRETYFKDNRKYQAGVHVDCQISIIRVYLNHPYSHYQQKYKLDLPTTFNGFDVEICDNVLKRQAVLRNSDLWLSGYDSHNPDVVW